jgi:hypothetical protein
MSIGQSFPDNLSTLQIPVYIFNCRVLQTVLSFLNSLLQYILRTEHNVFQSKLYNLLMCIVERKVSVYIQIQVVMWEVTVFSTVLGATVESEVLYNIHNDEVNCAAFIDIHFLCLS